jgi:hypothetical protein
MSLLKEATIEQAAAKVGIFGFQGSGKTTTAFLIAIGLSKMFHGGAPIAMHDTEGSSDFLVPIAQAEGIKLLRRKSTSFDDMVAVLLEAESLGACVFIQDQVSRTWAELMSSYQKRKGIKRLEFQHWNFLKEKWRTEFVDRYIASPLHCIVNGRAGYEYDTVEDEDGKRQQERVGTKFRAEGEFGYEPNLLIEMEGRRMPEVESAGPKKRRVRKQGGRIVHCAHVLKDRSRDLNGKTFEFKDINNYKAGDYKRVYETFAPHWALLNVSAGSHKSLDITSTLFAEEASGHDPRRGTRAAIACEEIEGMLVSLWPGQSAEAKRAKQTIVKELFDTYSWKSVEQRSVEELERVVEVMRRFMEAITADPSTVSAAANLDAVVALLRDARAKFRAETTVTTQIGVMQPEESAVI